MYDLITLGKAFDLHAGWPHPVKRLSELRDKILVQIIGAEKDSEEIYVVWENGDDYRMYQDQDCCEEVCIEDICGDVNCLLNTPIILAEDISNQVEHDWKGHEPDSYTWTWYKLATVKGYVTIRWLGTSNGYYSESVDVNKMTRKEIEALNGDAR